jgi:hypothetical protein
MLTLNSRLSTQAQALIESDPAEIIDSADRADHALLLLVSYVAFATLVLAVVSALLA